MSKELEDVYEQLMCEAFQCNNQKYRFVNKRYYKEKWKHRKALAAYLHCALIELLKRHSDDCDYQKCADMMDNKPSRGNVRTVLNVIKISNEKKSKKS